MLVQIACPNLDCDSTYSVADENLGKLGRCKKCGKQFPLVPGTRAHVEPSASQTDLEPAELPTQARIPESFGRYKVLKLLGIGGMGSVYLALDTQLNRQVALKVPHLHAFTDRPEVRERFFREAQAAARFHHPNFCPIHDIGEANGVPFLTMAFIEGKTLADSIQPNKGWPPRKAAEVVRELALALAKAHREGIIHRDLKPANIMIDADGRMILMDFGLARWYEDLDSTLTPTGAILGTPAYMPPEQAESKFHAVGPRSDLYSLGVILYELLTGRRPFDGPVAVVFSRLLFVEPDPPSSLQKGIDPSLEAICLKAMAKKPEKRHASMEEFAGALAAFLDQPPCAKPPRSQPLGEPIEPRKPIRTLVTAALMLVAILFGIIYVSTDKGRIKIEVNDPNAVVTVKGDNIRIDGIGEPITLRAGEHELLIKRGEGEFETRKFTVRRGENPALVVTLEPKSRPAPDPMPPAVAKADPPPVVEPKPEPPPDVPKKPVEMPKAVVEVKPSADETLITNTIGMKLKLIPAGEFFMGAADGEPESEADEKPQHKVRITKPFYLGIYEVTQAEYKAVVGTNPSNFSATGEGKEKVTGLDTDRFPVENVSWLDAIAFCNKLSEREGLRPCYTAAGELIATGTGYRLPTEAEWEYACRAGTTTPFSFGETIAPSDANFDGNYTYNGSAKGKSLERTALVGGYAPNAFGLHDMHGNVWEWCQDWSDDRYYTKSPQAYPQNLAQAGHRVIRGGSWWYNPQYCRSAFRGRNSPDFRDRDLGFRLVQVRPGK